MAKSKSKGGVRDYVNLGGRHVDLDGNVFEKGAIVKTADDLISMFGPEKFRLAGPGDYSEAEESDEGVVEVPTPSGFPGHDPKKAEEKARADAEEAEKAQTKAAEKAQTKAAKGKKPAKDEEEEEEDDGVAFNADEPPDYGEDVTAEFPDAKKAKMKVYHKGRDYTVVDKDTLAALHEDPLTSKKKVTDFIAENAE